MIFYKGGIALQLYLSVTPQEEQAASRFTRNLCHMAYRIGPQSSLLRREAFLPGKGGLLALSDIDAPTISSPEKLTRSFLRECGFQGYSGVVLDFEKHPTDDKSQFVRCLAGALSPAKKKLFLPQEYAVSGACAFISSAISGGSFTEYLEASRKQYGTVALDLQRLTMDFLLPSPTGEGSPMEPAAFQQLQARLSPSTFFSQELCARYFTYQEDRKTHFVLFDDAGTIRRKIQIGSTLGLSTGFLLFPEVRDLLPQIFS